ncbi:MAG: hypothetical protein Q7W16_07215 [Coriobacteriia bacterium]|nr:hypothetical protein [Coriobacteriia bacterium]
MDYSPAEHPARALAAVHLDPAALRCADGLAIVEIAGRDSVAAAVAAVRERGFRTVLPTAVATGTDYGDEGTPARAAKMLMDILGSSVEVLPLVRIGSPALWSALNGRYAAVLRGRYGLHSPCLACHLYMHLCRLPLAWELGDAPIVAGERDTHGGRLKVSQMPLGIDACVRVLARAGVELVEPIRHVHSAEEIVGLVGDGWEQGAKQLGCVLGGNYADLDGDVTLDEFAYARFVRGYLEPAGDAVVSAWRVEAEPDYDAIVRAVIEGPEAA